MNTDDWTHYGTHHDAQAAETLRKRHRPTLDANHAIFVRLEWLPEEKRQSWETLKAAKIRFFMILVDKRTGEIQHWVSYSRRCMNIWNNRNHPQFPWEIIIFIKIK